MSSPTTMKEFPFENYLTHDLPDYDHEWNLIIVKIILTSIFFLVIAPMLLKTIFRVKPKNTNEQRDAGNISSNDDGDSAVVNGKKDTTATKAKKKKNGSSNKVKVITSTTINGKSSSTVLQETGNNNNVDDSSSSSSTNVTAEVPLLLLIIMNLCYILTIFGFITFSPNNIDTARHVYQAPLLKQKECNMIIEMATRAAERNAEKARNDLASIPTFLGEANEFDDEENPYEDEKEKLETLLKWPEGWKKDRHIFHPTTDLSVVLDFEKEDLAKIAKILHARLSPLLARIYGISIDSIRANDMFVVRYDGEGQPSLNAHTDSSHVSFNILLNDGFVGGGTRYHNRLDETYYDAKPKPGDVLINNAMVRHEGLPTTEGTRYIFVGFMNVDRIDPWSGDKTKVPLYSTLLSFPWLTVAMKEFFDDEYHSTATVRGGTLNPLSQTQQMEMMSSAIVSTSVIGDYFAPHGLVKLISREKRKEYLNDLDEFYEENNEHLDKSIWYKGQQIKLNMDGTFQTEWQDRKKYPENFVEL